MGCGTVALVVMRSWRTFQAGRLAQSWGDSDRYCSIAAESRFLVASVQATSGKELKGRSKSSKGKESSFKKVVRSSR